MPTGSFWGDSLSEQGQRYASSGNSMTGSGAPSQPKWPWDNGVQVTMGAGYTPGMATPYPVPQGATAGTTYQLPSTASSQPSLATSVAAGNLTGAQSLVTSLYGPQQTLLDQQLSRQYDQLGMVGMDADYKTDALHRDNALANQALGIDRRELGVDADLTNTQLANLGRLREILGKQYGLQGEQLANQLAGFKINEDKARDMAKRHTFDLRSALTARGAFNTVANDRGTGRINRDLDYALRDINVGRKGADISYRGNILGLDEKGIGYDNQAAGLNAQLKKIGLDVERLGISEQQLANNLADGLHQIGLDSMISVNGLLDAIGGTNAQQSQLAATILQEVMGYANLPPDVLAAISKALGIPLAPTAGSMPTPGAPGLSPEERGIA